MHVAPACLDTDVARVPEQKEGQQLAAFPSRRGLLGNSRDVTGSLDISLEQGGQSAHEELHKAALRAPQVGRAQPALPMGPALWSQSPQILFPLPASGHVLSSCCILAVCQGGNRHVSVQSVPGGRMNSGDLQRLHQPHVAQVRHHPCRGKDARVRLKKSSRNVIEGEKNSRQRAQQVERHGGIKEPGKV